MNGLIMKHKLLKISNLALCVFVLFPCGLRAQISEGGQPFSWTLPTELRQAQKAALEATRVFLSPPDISVLLQRDAAEGRQNRFAEAIPIQLNLHNAGNWLSLPNGDRLWQLHLIAQKAQSLRPLFDSFDLPTGAKFLPIPRINQYIEVPLRKKTIFTPGVLPLIPCRGMN
ncbi:MAG: hypothetical protein HC913_11725 [Microscillaceae bacterium]|nr:hypothetical protein [Microscillaceae bacterium]